MGTTDVLQGKWQQLKGSVKQRWGELTDDDLTQINGSREKLEGRLRERYGHDEARIRREVDAWSEEQGL
jgi:uncharacterized protein YjbJ (UPF0337 family)